MRRLLLLLLFFVLLLAPPAHAQLLNPSPGGVGSTATFAPGPVHITGNSGDGTDKITGLANLQGEMYANNFSGADIGAKVNNAIGALGAQGGIVHIAPGQYSFSTTIQCPVTGNSNEPIIIEGSGQANSNNPTQGTLLGYTGNGDAVNQVETNPTYQNIMGCQLRDLTISGVNAGTNAVGLHIGGTQYSATSWVTIQQFKKAGIELENVNVNMWTERYSFRDTSLWLNAVQIYFHGATSNLTSFGHGTIEAWFNVDPGETGMLLDSAAYLYAETITLNGNLPGNPGTLVSVINSDFMQGSFFPNVECNNAPCTMFNVSSGSTVALDIINESPGPWSNNLAAGANYQVTQLSQAENGNILSTSGTIWANQDPTTMLQPQAAHGTLNSAANIYTIANGANVAVASSCAGLILACDRINGDNGVYICGGGFCSLVSTSFPNASGTWQTAATNPAAGKASVYFAGSATNTYNIYNNTGSSRPFSVMALCNKESQ